MATGAAGLPSLMSTRIAEETPDTAAQSAQTQPDPSPEADREAQTSAAQKSYATILEQEIQEGVDELERPARGLLLSGLSAGLDIGFSVLAIGLVETLVADQTSDLAHALLRANAYALGFVLVIFGRSELFTEHTTLAVLPLLDGRTSPWRLGRLWGLVYAANLMGVAVFSALVAVTGPGLGTIDPDALSALAGHVLDHDAWVIALSAVLAGWLMGIVSWLVTAGRDTISQIVFVWLITSLIGLAGLHHCILGSAEVLTAVFAGASVSLIEALRFLAIATVGNVIGGFFFVAIVKYGHASVLRPGLRDPRGWQRSDDR